MKTISFFKNKNLWQVLLDLYKKIGKLETSPAAYTPPYKSYVCQITHIHDFVGTMSLNAVYENTVLGVLAWNRTALGTFQLTVSKGLVGQFSYAAFFQSNVARFVSVEYINDNTLELKSYDAAGALSDVFGGDFQLRVYNQQP